MSQRGRKKTLKKKKISENRTSSPCESSSAASVLFANISIRIHNFDNLHYLLDNDETKEELEIVARFLSEKINSVNVTRINERNKNSFEIVYGIRVNVSSEEEIFDICANPVLLSLLKHKKEGGAAVTLGHCNIDMLALCTPYIESITYRKHFERETSHFRKVSFDCQISSDAALLKEPYGNLLYLTIDSIHNFVAEDEITVGFKAPMNSQFSKFLTFTQTSSSSSPDNKIRTSKHWFNLTQISGNGSKSNHHHEAYNFPQQCGEKILLHNSHKHMKINKIMRIILTNDGKNFLHNHIRREMKLAVELMHNNRHMIGFIDAGDLLHIGRKRVKVAVPLFEFNEELLMKKCAYESSWIKSKGINLICNEIPVLDECGRESFVIVELELEKPFNEEVYVDSKEDLTTEVNALVSEQKITNLRENLQAFAGNLLRKESNPSKALLSAISNGRFVQIKEQLLPSFYELARDDEIIEDFQCRLTWKLMKEREPLPLMDDQTKMLLGKFYQALGMETEADEISLQEITKNSDSEDAWLKCGVHYIRRQCYEKAVVCIDKALRIKEGNFVGEILKEFLDLKLGKIDECEKIGKFMKKSPEMLDDFLSDSHEVLWYSGTEDNLLSCHDNYVKFAVIFIKLGCYDIAEECIGEYYSHRGANVNYFYLLAAIDAQKGDHHNALLYLNKISENDVGNHNINHTKILATICINLMLSGRNENAVDLFNKFIGFESCDNFLLLFLIGRHYSEIKNHEKALELLTKASQLLPCELIFNELGKSHEKLRNFEMAERYFQRAVKYGWNRNSRNGWQNLLHLYQNQHRIDAAKLCENYLKEIF